MLEGGGGKCLQVKVAGEGIFIDHLECVGDVRLGCRKAFFCYEI